MTVESRGTSNTNDRGSAEQRRKRKQWLFEVWGADVDILSLQELHDLANAFRDDGFDEHGIVFPARLIPFEEVWSVAKGLGRPAVRCFRCGCLLDWDSVEIDRIKPGCEGGRYHKNNIRPICERDNKILSGEHVRKRNAKRKKRNEQARARRRAARAETYESHA